MKFSFTLIFLFFGLLSCQYDKLSLNIKTCGTLTLVDSTLLAGHFQTYDPYYREGCYPVFFIGSLMDSLKLRPEPISKSLPYRKTNYTGQYWRYPDNSKMTITVDTCFNLSYKIFYRHYAEVHQKSVVDSCTSYFAYPVIIHNLSDTILFLGMGNHLESIVRQAKNKENVWVDIESPFDYHCGTCLRDLIVDVDEILVAKLTRYKGDFKTVCRLKYQKYNNIVYSNTFVDYIDYRQLTDPLRPKY